MCGTANGGGVTMAGRMAAAAETIAAVSRELGRMAKEMPLLAREVMAMRLCLDSATDMARESAARLAPPPPGPAPEFPTPPAADPFE